MWMNLWVNVDLLTEIVFQSKKLQKQYILQEFYLMWYLYTMEFYWGIKKNEILLFAGKWMELENIILNEVIQVWKAF
jgi:hypothetical protein